jgi:hypothetical protein
MVIFSDGFSSDGVVLLKKRSLSKRKKPRGLSGRGAWCESVVTGSPLRPLLPNNNDADRNCGSGKVQVLAAGDEHGSFSSGQTSVGFSIDLPAVAVNNLCRRVPERPETVRRRSTNREW